MSNDSAPRLLPLALLVLCAFAVPAAAGTITFDEPLQGLSHGEIVAGQYALSHGVKISAVNYHRGFHLAAAFDTSSGSSADPDLLGPPWTPGNLGTTPLGNVLIIAEDDRDSSGNHITSGILDDPDDEGRRPAGKLVFEFDKAITEFGFDLVDIEEREVGKGYFATISSGGVMVAQLAFSRFTTFGDYFYDPTVKFAGDNTANRISTISAFELSQNALLSGQQAFRSFDKIEIQLGGSGAVDNLVFAVPLPMGAWAGLTLLGGLGVLHASRRRRRRRA